MMTIAHVELLVIEEQWHDIWTQVAGNNNLELVRHCGPTEMRGDADKRVSKNQTANMDEFRRMDWKMSR